jgi:hypothetical protein
MATPRGVRNNNPGNIRYVEGITSTYAGCVGSDGAFCKFDTAENGIRALGKLLRIYQSKHGLRTIRGIITRWAPPSENDTEAYVRSVVEKSGFLEAVALDLQHIDDLFPLVVAIITHENGGQPYDLGMIRAALEGTVPPVATQPAAPIEDKGVQMEQQPASTLSFDWSSVLQVGGAVASFFNPAIGVLISSLGGLAQQKIEKELSRHTDPATAKTVAAQLSTALADAATKATGKSDPIAAIAELRANPAAVAQVEAAVTTKIEQINELTEVGGGIIEARKAGADPAALPAWRQGPFWISLILLLVGGAIVGSVLWGAGWRPEDKSQVLMLAVSLFSMTGGFWLGSSIGSSRKTDMFNNARTP